MRLTRILLVIVAAVCFGVALSYPIRYYLAQKSNDGDMEQLSAMRARVQSATSAPESPEVGEPASGGAGDGTGEGAPGETEEGSATAAPAEVRQGGISVAPEGNPMDDPSVAPAETEKGGAISAPVAPVETTESGAAVLPEAEIAKPATVPADAPAIAATPEPTATPVSTSTPEPSPTPTLDPYYWDLTRYEGFLATATPEPTAEPQAAGPADSMEEAGPTRDPFVRTGALPYDMKEKVALDEAAILPELVDIYALNRDLVGWLTIPDTVIDYPVVQTQDSEFYLTHDFYGEENVNGQIILDAPCDPYTPSYNLVISGHHMKNGSMFGGLPQYRSQKYWEQHRFLEFDTLMARKWYVVFAAFYSADYDEDEKGFRYNADIRFKIDANQWLSEVRENQLYDTGIDAEFGDEFITLTTCDRARHRNGRFVVVARKIREGEIFE